MIAVQDAGVGDFSSFPIHSIAGRETSETAPLAEFPAILIEAKLDRGPTEGLRIWRVVGTAILATTAMPSWKLNREVTILTALVAMHCLANNLSD
jgi:hypothetical protein